MPKAGDTFWVTFHTHSSAGALANADSLPAGTLAKNGTDDGTVTVTVSNVSTGRYRATGTIPGSYAAGDVVELCITATISAVTVGQTIGLGQIDKRVNDALDSSNRVDLGKCGGSTVAAGAIPNAPAGAANGLLINGVNAGTVTLAALTVTADMTVGGYLYATSFVGNLAGSVTGSVNGSVFGTIYGLGAGVITAASIADGAITAAKIAADAITAAKIAADAIGASELAASAVDEIVDAVHDEQLSGHVTAGSTGKALADVPTATGIAAAVWDRLASAIVTVGSIGKWILDKLDVAVSTRAATGATVTTVSGPVADDGKLTLIQGDDHSVGDRLPTWNITNYNGPSLAGATGQLRLLAWPYYLHRAAALNNAVLEVTATIVQTGTTVAVTAALTAAQAALLASASDAIKVTHAYQVIATTSGALKVTLALGECTVRRHVTPAA